MTANCLAEQMLNSQTLLQLLRCPVVCAVKMLADVPVLGADASFTSLLIYFVQPCLSLCKA